MSKLISPLKPGRTYGFVSLAVLAVMAVVALAAAWGALVAVERISQSAVTRALFLTGEDWAQVEVNGLQVILSGDAPTEAARFAALSAASHEVDGARVIDQMALPEAVAIEPPKFSVEMLRNEAGISLIGLIPAASDREALNRRMRAIDPIQPVADFLETAEFPTPEGWDSALDFALDMAAMLPRSKISMSADNVVVEAIAAAPDQKRDWEQEIRRKRPAGLRLALDIRAPLDVISPYTLRFLSDEQGARFDACTAYTTAGRNRIVSAGIAAGVKGAVDCTIGLGVPSPDWPQAVARGIQAVRDMGGGALTFSDADITLIAPANTPRDTFDRVTGELEADLPEVFSLHSVLTEPETGTASPAGIPEFIASLADSGAVQLRGRVASEQDRTIVETLARARFGMKKVYAPLRLDPALPEAWAVRTLAGLEALDQLAEGRVLVRPDVVTVSGTTGDKRASAEISRLLSEKLGEAEDFRVNVTYEEALDPVAAMPTPQECVADVNAALNQNKITFAPGSAEIERASMSTVDRIAEILKTCPDVAMEIGGYTDSQGREEMNQALSQRRAEAVVSALLARRVLTTNLKAFGYGEEYPIADNDTEEGREANRRIEFSLVGETRPRGEPATEEGEDPTIRPQSRPEAADGETVVEEDEAGPDAAQAEDALAEGTADDGLAGDDAGTDDAGTDDAAGEDTGPQDPAAQSPETGDATPTDTTGDAAADDPASDDRPAEDATAAVTNDATQDADAAPAAALQPEAEADASAEDAPATETVPAEPAVEADVDAALDTDSAAETPADETGAEDVAVDDVSTATVAESPETGVTDTGAPATDTAPGNVAALAEADQPADPETDDGPGTTPEAGADPATAMEANATPEVGTAADTTANAVPDDLDAAATPEVTAEDETDPVSDEALAAAQSAAPVPPQEAEDSALADPDAVLTAEAETEAGDPGTAARETPSAEAAEAAEAALSYALDIPAIRPPARPPLVVHPDLAGVRPRPRPAVIPAAPTTE